MTTAERGAGERPRPRPGFPAQGRQDPRRTVTVVRSIAGIAHFEGTHCRGVWEKPHSRHCNPCCIAEISGPFIWKDSIAVLQYWHCRAHFRQCGSASVNFPLWLVLCRSGHRAEDMQFWSKRTHEEKDTVAICSETALSHVCVHDSAHLAGVFLGTIAAPNRGQLRTGSHPAAEPSPIRFASTTGKSRDALPREGLPAAGNCTPQPPPATLPEALAAGSGSSLSSCKQPSGALSSRKPTRGVPVNREQRREP